VHCRTHFNATSCAALGDREEGGQEDVKKKIQVCRKLGVDRWPYWRKKKPKFKLSGEMIGGPAHTSSTQSEPTGAEASGGLFGGICVAQDRTSSHHVFPGACSGRKARVAHDVSAAALECEARDTAAAATLLSVSQAHIPQPVPAPHQSASHHTHLSPHLDIPE